MLSRLSRITPFLNHQGTNQQSTARSICIGMKQLSPEEITATTSKSPQFIEMTVNRTTRSILIGFCWKLRLH